MEIITLIIVASFMGLLAIIDLLNKKVPSVLIDTFLILSFSLNTSHLIWGVYGFIFGYLLYDLGLFDGIADLKLIAAIGLFSNSMAAIWLFIFLICLIGVFYKMAWKKWIGGDTCAFIPVIVFAGAIML